MITIPTNSATLDQLNWLLSEIECKSGSNFNIWDGDTILRLIHKYGIEFKVETGREDQVASVAAFPTCSGGMWGSGKNHTIAAARCVVMSKLGLTAKVPDDYA